MNEQPTEWVAAQEGWRAFCTAHPELGQTPALWRFYNLLRGLKPALLEADAIRKVSGKHWIIHRERFDRLVFDLLTRAKS